MATPLCAWAVSVVVEYLQRVHKVVSPSTSLVKGLLITAADTLVGTAQDLRRQAIIDGGRKVSTFRTKSALDLYDQGFGRVNLDKILSGNIGFKQGEVIGSYSTQTPKFCFKPTRTEEVSIGLTWSDPPAFVHSQHTLINDLDLVVVYSNRTYFGNLGWQPDNVNNVERVRMHVTEEEQLLEVYIGLPRSPLIHLRPKLGQEYSLTYSGSLTPTACIRICDENSPPYYASYSEVYRCNTAANHYSSTKSLLVTSTDVLSPTHILVDSSPACYRNIPCLLSNSEKGTQYCDFNTKLLSECKPEYSIIVYPQLHHSTKRGLARFLSAVQDATTGGINISLWGTMVATAEVYLLAYFFLIRR
jgi:hypothetical protein